NHVLSPSPQRLEPCSGPCTPPSPPRWRHPPLPEQTSSRDLPHFPDQVLRPPRPADRPGTTSLRLRGFFPRESGCRSPPSARRMPSPTTRYLSRGRRLRRLPPPSLHPEKTL